MRSPAGVKLNYSAGSDYAKVLCLFKGVALPPDLKKNLAEGLICFLFGRWRNSKEQAEANLKRKRSGSR